MNLAYNYPNKMGEQCFWLNTTNGIGGDITNYANGILSEWAFSPPGYGPKYSLPGSGSFNISNYNDNGTTTTITFDFSYTGSQGTSSGHGTFIYPDSAVTVTTYSSSIRRPNVLRSVK